MKNDLSRASLCCALIGMVLLAPGVSAEAQHPGKAPVLGFLSVNSRAASMIERADKVIR